MGFYEEYKPLRNHMRRFDMLTGLVDVSFMVMNTCLEHIRLIAGFVMTALIAEHAKRSGRP
jgi:uncharacterized protein YggT (Ycf19 family)